MKHAVLADSGPLYATADEDDAYHEQAQHQLEELARGGEKWSLLIRYCWKLMAS